MNASLEFDRPMMPDELVSSVNEKLASFLSTQKALWPEPSPSPAFEEVSQFILNGGKRLRSAFCYYGYWGAGGGGGVDDLGVISAGAALELLHSFALIHDDVMDASHTRRGHPTVHRDMSTLHQRSGWFGDSDLFGTGVAILLGDLCFSWSEEMFSGCGLPFERIERARRTMTLMRTETIAGQYLDLGEGAHPGTVESALQVIRLKTARYTVERPLQIGVALAGGDDAAYTACSEFGEPLGEAFQLRDDLLGVFGDPEKTGKSNLDDLREGKATVLMAHTRARADQRELKLLGALVGHADLDEAGAAEVRKIIINTGAAAEVERMIDDRVTTASILLEQAPLTEWTRQALEVLVGRCVQRSR